MSKECRSCIHGRKKCDVCLVQKPRGAFSESQLQNAVSSMQNFVLRCQDCHKCSSCGEERPAQAFDGLSKECKKCIHGKKRCDVCLMQKPRGAFSESQLHNAVSSTQNLFLRCQECHRCVSCGHVKFAQGFAGDAKQCLKCEAAERKTWKCDACNVHKAFSGFNQYVLQNARKHARRSVCLDCQMKGYSPKDVTGYPCAGCQVRGHLKFDARARRSYERARQDACLVCQDCEKKKSALEKILRRNDSWRCTCPGSGRKRKHLQTNQKCQLAPVYAGERRWPGSNNGVAFADIEFLQRVHSAYVL